MDQNLFTQYLREYTLEALEHGGDNVSAAADYLAKKSRASIFSKNRKEKNAALQRAQKVFSSSRERSLYVLLKSLGFDELAKDKL